MTKVQHLLVVRLVGFAHRLAYATLLSGAAWVMCSLVTDHVTNPLYRAVFLILDAPAAVASLPLPLEWRAIDFVFERSLMFGFNTAEYLVRHLRVSVPAYMVLFYLPNLIRAGRNWFRRRREVAASAPLSAPNR